MSGYALITLNMIEYTNVYLKNRVLKIYQNYSKCV